jgi:hypothetical protein
MRGISKLLLFDKGVVGKPVEELRPIRPDYLGLRIVDVGVDEAGRDEATAVIVDERVRRGMGENVARFSNGLDQPARNENGAVLDERIGARAAYSRIIGEREDAATNDASGLPQDRMSLSLSAAMRSISARAVFVSASASLARRLRKAARMSAVLLPLTAMMKGKPNRAR